MTSITLRGIEKTFGAETALRSCDLVISDREFLVLVGPSGSGKTTLLRIISGLEQATNGEIYFGDRLVNDIDVGDRDIAMVFQNYGLYPHMSVYNNMAFGLRRRKIPKQDIDRKVNEAAQMLGIGALLHRKPRQLSGGQRQRVALGRAIVRDPAVFLLDEPLSNLDAHLRTQMRSEILKVHRTVTATAVYVTHDQVEALTMGDRIAVMSDGVIQQVDTPEALYDRPVNRFVAGFIGTPPMGFLPGAVRRQPGTTKVTGEGLHVCLPSDLAGALPAGTSEVVVGVRPEALRLVADSFTEDESESWLQGIVDVIEPLGSEKHVLLTSAGVGLVAKLPRTSQVDVGQKITLAIEPTGGLHVFDADTGVALRPEDRR
ncbi:ABC transporter ATP-binding protein [Micromonospora yasonensis]|uniref:ABC transporter ATP-binding protein n=1 Tax=Micromonospora yasonensis TaxID=1128667 RepID=UPI00222F1098|nr:ABC transporter ATP-binding protein [Micromonospora yasonensis]MCW3840693.1 ABC transporter ATP-binding protein [Micromonospora yasonensis]